MRYLLLLFLFSFSVIAESEVGISYKRINQDLFGTIEFPMDAASLSYTYWHDSGFGLRLAGGKSTETANALYVEGKQYSAKILHMWESAILYRYQVGKWSPFVGVGRTDYKTDWTVNSKPPEWRYDSDSDWSYYAGVGYQIEPNVRVDFEYVDWYRKNKPGYGRETTRGFQIRLSYRF